MLPPPRADAYGISARRRGASDGLRPALKENEMIELKLFF